MVSQLEWVTAWAGAVLCGDMFIVVLAHKGMTCVALDELAVDAAACMGEMFVGLQGWSKSVGLKECTWALELFAPFCCPGIDEVLEGLCFLV